MAKKRSKPRFRVGDWVGFFFGTRQAMAQIIEDRGPLGVGGRWMYRVRMGSLEGSPDEFEISEDALAPAAPPSPPRFRVGDWVRLQFYPRRPAALINEVRVPLGDGRWVYRVRQERRNADPFLFDVTEDGLALAAPAKVSEPA